MCLGYFKENNLNAFEFIVLILPSTYSMFFIILAYDPIAICSIIDFQNCINMIAAPKRDFELLVQDGFKYSIFRHIFF